MAKQTTPSILERLLDGDSSFSTNGIQPIITTTAGENTIQNFFDGSNLDLNGVTPITYQSQAPEGQAGRIGSSTS